MNRQVRPAGYVAIKAGNVPDPERPRRSRLGRTAYSPGLSRKGNNSPSVQKLSQFMFEVSLIEMP